MCGKRKTLVKSHLFPRASYRYFREQGFDPVFMSEDVMRPTQKQIWAHLLCRECDNIFNEQGEGWLMPRLARYLGEFPLYDLVKTTPDVTNDGGSPVHATVGHPNIRTEKLVHFGVGIFYKSSLHHWLAKPPGPFIHLGKWGEPARKFLRGEGPFCDDLALCLTISPPPVRNLCFTLPRYFPRDGFGQFMFYFGGMKFDLLFGDGLREIKRLCLHASPEKLVLVDSLEKEMEMVIKLGTKNARRTRKLLDDAKRRKAMMTRSG